MPFLGAHLSAAGGAWRAVQAASETGCEALQLFLRAPARWATPPLLEEDVARFRAMAADAGLVGRCYAHAPYLLNLASSDEALRRRSLAVLTEELRRAGDLGLAGVVLHPGSAGSGDVDEAVARCRAAIAEATADAGPGTARLLLEGTAGAGGQLGRTPEQLARLVPDEACGRVGVCLDTAHLWGAGYDLRGRGWDRVIAEVRDAWRVDVPDLLHINDTPVALGSRRDRHAAPGEGALGEDFFLRLIGDSDLAEVAMILEIPPGPGNRLVRRVLRRLRDRNSPWRR